MGTQQMPDAAQFEALLRDPFVWREHVCVTLRRTARLARTKRVPQRPVPGRLLGAFLAACERVHDERTMARDTAAVLLNMSPSSWRAYLTAHADIATCGLVTEVVSAAEAIDLPVRIHELTSLGLEIARRLLADDPGNVRAAWASVLAKRHHASALVVHTRYLEALDVCDAAERELAAFATGAYERGIVTMVRAHALIRLGRADEGYAAASRASRVFAEFGDRKRLATARLTEAYALHEAGRREEALVLWFALLRDARSRKDAEMRAYVYNNIGTEFSDRGEYAKATTYLERALRYFVTHNLLEEIPRTRLALAVMRASQGDLSGAIPALWRVHREFMDLRMFNAATGVELRIVEYLLELGRTTEAETLCRRLPAAFGEEGFLASARSAASHLAECARRNVLEVADVRHVRLFLKDLPQDPRRAFTPRVNVRVGQ